MHLETISIIGLKTLLPLRSFIWIFTILSISVINSSLIQGNTLFKIVLYLLNEMRRSDRLYLY